MPLRAALRRPGGTPALVSDQPQFLRQWTAFTEHLFSEFTEDTWANVLAAGGSASPLETICVRSKNTISIHSEAPWRTVQIVLRLYSSPAEILVGFDIDSACFGYDGRRVWATPRALIASMRQSNTVDMGRRSPSYEFRLAKYADRGYEILLPSLQRPMVKPEIYRCSASDAQGLARLLVLESL
ncbi:hypothetical protein CYLTODRAFT_336741, partial [Cylindrobasidium torrendii FP15055 ss-10]